MILAALLFATIPQQVDQTFATAFEKSHAPGAVLGIIVDGKLAYVKTAGIRDVATKAPVTEDTRFRIASMTKGFTAMSILKLRDAGKLQLDDAAAKYIPELASLKYPTTDSPVITIRMLLNHAEGFPEDNPWGDRQLAQTNETLSAWMKAGIPFSRSPGIAYEYSNYGFAILGQIVERVSGMPYKTYVTENILKPLGMTSSTFDMESIPKDKIAYGYRWEDNQWKPEPILPHGAFGSMGGLWTTVGDLSKYVSFLLSAFPPRDDPESGPIRRASAREMQQPWRLASAGTRTNPQRLNVAAYAYGLRIAVNCDFSYIVTHGGGLPGYGSLETWLPDYNAGVITFTNGTYTNIGDIHNDILTSLQLQKRAAVPSAALLQAKSDVSLLIEHWDQQLAGRIVASNFFLDQNPEQRQKRYSDLAAQHGVCHADPEIDAENALRGTWRMTCERGFFWVRTTLAPTMPPKVQSVGIAEQAPPPPAACRPAS